MTAAGSEGTSWIDAAVSDANAQAAGAAAAQGIQRGMSILPNLLGGIGQQASAGFAGAFSGAGPAILQHFIPHGPVIVRAFQQTGEQSAAAFGQSFMGRLQSTMQASSMSGQAESFGQIFGRAGAISGDMFSREFTNQVASTIQGLGGVSSENIVSSLRATGMRGGEAMAGGIAQSLEAGLAGGIGSATLNEAVGRLMNGAAAHGGAIFASTLPNDIRAALSATEGIITDQGERMKRVMGLVGQGMSQEFFHNYALGMEMVAQGAMPGEDAMVAGARAAGIHVASEFGRAIVPAMQTAWAGIRESAKLGLGDTRAIVDEWAEDMGIELQDAMGDRLARRLGGALNTAIDSGRPIMEQGSTILRKSFTSGFAGFEDEFDELMTRAMTHVEDKLAPSPENVERAWQSTYASAGPELRRIMTSHLDAAGGDVNRALQMAGGIGAEGYTTAFAAAMGSLGTKLAPVVSKVMEGLNALGGGAGTDMGFLMMQAMGLAVAAAAHFVVTAFKDSLALINKEVEEFGKFGKDAAETFMGSFEAVVSGKLPDFNRILGTVMEGAEATIRAPFNVIQTSIDATLGQIPILGGAFTAMAGEMQQALGAVFAVFGEYKNIALEFEGVLTDIGNKWQEAARIIAGQTLGTENLEHYLDIVRDIAASGDLVHFKDVAEAVGELSQRLSNLSNGAGLSSDQLKELTTTLAEGDELLGNTKINVDNFTAALNSFNVPAERANEALTMLINLERETGANINDLTRDLDQTSPAWEALGFNMEEAAYIMAKINEELGRPAMNRFSFALARLPETLDKANLSQAQLNGVLRDYMAANDEASAIDFAKPFLGSAKAAENYIDALMHGIPLAVGEAAEAVERDGANLHQPLDVALEATKNLENEMEVLSQQVQAALAPLGVGLVESLTGVGDNISTWLQTHQVEFIGWVTTIGEKLLDWGVKITHFLADMTRDMSGIMEVFKDVVVVGLGAVDVAFAAFLSEFQLIPAALAKWDPTGILGGLKGMATGAANAIGPLHALYEMDLGGTMRTAASGMDAFGNSLQGLEGPLADLGSKGQDTAAFWQGFRATFASPLKGPDDKDVIDKFGNIVREGAPKLQDGLSGGIKEGLKIDPAAQAEVTDQLKNLGVGIDIDPTGKVTGFTTHTKKEMDDLVKYLQTRFGKENFPDITRDIKFTNQNLPDETVKQYLTQHMGVPSELAGDDGIHANVFLDMKGLSPDQQKLFNQVLGGAPATTSTAPKDEDKRVDWGSFLISPFLSLLGTFAEGGTVPAGGDASGVLIKAHPGEKVMNLGASTRFGSMLDWMNVQSFAQGGTVGEAAGIPPSMQGALAGTGITLPAGIQLVTPQPLDESDALTRAGIPEHFQGDIQVSGVAQTGVALPAGFNVRPSDRQSASALMDSMGIPSQLQGDEGIKLPIQLDTEGATTTGGTAAPTAQTSYSGPGSVEGWRPAVQAALMQRGGIAGFNGGGQPGDPNSIQWARPTAGQAPGEQFMQGRAGWLGGSAEVWRPKIEAALMRYGGMAGIPPSAYPAWESAILRQIQTESGGNPNAVAKDPSDPNVQKGIPSLGLLQFTPGTYAAHNPTGLPYPDPYGEIAATLFYAPHGPGGEPAGGAMGIGQGHGFQRGGMPLPLGVSPDIPKWPYNEKFRDDYLQKNYGSFGIVGGSTGPGTLSGPSMGNLLGGPIGFQEGGEGQELGPTHEPYGAHAMDWLHYLYGEKGLAGSSNLLGGPIGFAGGGPLKGGARASLSYHHPAGLAPHVGLPQASTSIWKHMATGGHVQGTWWPGRDTVPMRVPPGTFIVNRERAAQHRDVLDRIMGSHGGAAHTAGQGTDIITEVGERIVPPNIAMPNAHLLHAINKGKLIRRQGGGGTGVLQVIYNPPGTQEYYGEAAGYGRVGPGTAQPQYYNADWGGHHGHVHTSFDTGPDGQPYGMPAGTNLPATGHESAGFPSWVYALGRQYGVYASTYPGHQEHGGKNHGLDWWPLGKADMSGLSYTPEERDRLRSFASAMVAAGAGTGGPSSASGFSGFGGTGLTTTGGAPGGYSFSSMRAGLKAIMPPWLSHALGLQQGGPVIIPSPSGMLGGQGPEDQTPAPPPPPTWDITIHGKSKGDPFAPKVPDQPGYVAPPASWAQAKVAEPGAARPSPTAVSTEYGWFEYPFNLPDKGAGIPREERDKITRFLHGQEHTLEQGTKDQEDLGKATTDHNDAEGLVTQAEIDYANALKGLKLDELKTEQDKQIKLNQALGESTSDLYKANKELKEAHDKEATTSKALEGVNQRIHDNQVNQYAASQATPPWVSTGGGGGGGVNQNAAAMGQGLISGIGQELGFPDVFGKPPWQWGLWKLFAGGANFGINLLNALGDKAGGAGGGGGGGGAGDIFGSLFGGAANAGGFNLPGLGFGGGQTGDTTGGAPGGPPAAPGGPPAPAAPGDQPTMVNGVLTYPASPGVEADVASPTGGFLHRHPGLVPFKGFWYPPEKLKLIPEYVDENKPKPGQPKSPYPPGPDGSIDWKPTGTPGVYQNFDKKGNATNLFHNGRQYVGPPPTGAAEPVGGPEGLPDTRAGSSAGPLEPPLLPPGMPSALPEIPPQALGSVRAFQQGGFGYTPGDPTIPPPGHRRRYEILPYPPFHPDSPGRRRGIQPLPVIPTIQPPTHNLVSWAEPSTGGEAFIPLRGGDRSRQLVRTVGNILGMKVMDDGGIVVKGEDIGKMKRAADSGIPGAPSEASNLAAMLSSAQDPAKGLGAKLADLLMGIQTNLGAAHAGGRLSIVNNNNGIMHPDAANATIQHAVNSGTRAGMMSGGAPRI